MLKAPEILSKSSTSITLQLPSKKPNVLGYRVGYSEYGYLYYSWNYINSKTSACIIKGLNPNTTYVTCVAYLLKDHENEYEREYSEYSDISHCFRTFTEDEDLKRTGTVYEHAFRIEREEKKQMQDQIKRLECLLDTSTLDSKNKLEHSGVVDAQEKLLKDRVEKDTVIAKLREELSHQAIQLSEMEHQKATHEKLIMELMNENERQSKEECKSSSSSNENTELLSQYSQKAKEDEEKIKRYQEELAAKRMALTCQEQEVERIMQDCRRVVQEHADTAQAKELQMEEALNEAKASLVEQVEHNRLLEEEVHRLQQENERLRRG